MGGEHPVLNVGWSGGEGGRGTGRADGGGEWEVSYQQCAMCHPILSLFIADRPLRGYGPVDPAPVQSISTTQQTATLARQCTNGTQVTACLHDVTIGHLSGARKPHRRGGGGGGRRGGAQVLVIGTSDPVDVTVSHNCGGYGVGPFMPGNLAHDTEPP